MKSPKPFFYIGSWLLLLTGVGDLLATDFLRTVFLEIEDKDRVFGLMADSDVSFLGLHTSLMGIYNGFSLAGGFLLFAFGLMNLLIARACPDILFKSRSILGLDVLVSLCLLVISVNRFPIHGSIIFALVLLAFLVAFVFQELIRRSASKATVLAGPARE